MQTKNSCTGDSPFLSELGWKFLIRRIHQGLVVPIIGPELLSISSENNKSENFYDIWGKDILAASHNKPCLCTNLDSPILYQATNWLAANPCPEFPNISYIADYLDDLVNNQNKKLPCPDAIRQLAEIRGFPLYVTITVDSFLTHAVRKATPDTLVADIAFRPHGVKTEIDLPKDFTSESTQRIIYYLFGKANPKHKPFAVMEDEFIEFSWSLIDDAYSPEIFYDYLADKTILMLGCSFPDWLGRFLIYALRKKRNIDLRYVSRRSEQGLVDFIKRQDRNNSPLCPCDPVAFVDELHRRWSDTVSQSKSDSIDKCEPPKNSAMENGMILKPGFVFISYAGEDAETAVAIHDQLASKGIPVWLDRQRLEWGDNWWETIRGIIANAAAFLPIISRHVSGESPRNLQGRPVFREWRAALKTAEDRPFGSRFLFPVFIDGTHPDSSTLPPEFRAVHKNDSISFENHCLSDDALVTLLRIVRNFKRASIS